MVKFSLDDRDVEAGEGSPLVEAIKQNGSFISNLCYVDGIPPYAGCRTCLVEIEGARGLQLACTSRVAEGMVVRTETDEVLEARQAVLSIINANHSDRCLTCHRRVHCQPGDVCLRDDAVTHRCLTCAKNYRCELQTTNEMLQMANYEPWIGEARTYYESEPPEADRANPFLEFDPQMCIICTRCVRACDEIRHTGAITLAGRGEETRIAFGSGGPVHESDCDFCGACIDVCPTATLLEQPNKWIAKTETWVSSACDSCSVGCTVSMGVRNGKVVMVKPDQLNPVSDDQICVRGRFHYDSLKPRQRLTRHLVRSGNELAPATFEVAIESAADGVSGVVEQYGAESVGVLVGSRATNEEAYAARILAREAIGTANLDSTAGSLMRSVNQALETAFGTAKLDADLSQLAQAKTIVVVAPDLESSHNIAALRVKDAAVNNDARLIVVSSRYGEVCDFIAPPPAGAIMPSPQRFQSPDPTGVWLRPGPGGETATLTALGQRVAGRLASKAEGVEELLAAEPASDVAENEIETATSILAEAAKSDDGLAIVFAPSAEAPLATGEAARAAANLAVLCRGERGGSSFYHLPLEANAVGLFDMGVFAAEGETTASEILSGGVKALICVGDNPAMSLAGQTEMIEALDSLECLVTIDSVTTDTAQRSHVAFADMPTQGKQGTFTSADRRVLRLSEAESPTGDQRPALEVIAALGTSLSEKLGKQVSKDLTSPEAVTAEIARSLPEYAGANYKSLESGMTRAQVTQSKGARLQTPSFGQEPLGDGLRLLSGRTLYTSYEAAAIHSEEADKLHREEFLEINPSDAARLKIEQNRPVVVSRNGADLELSAALTDAVAPGSVFLPLFYDGGIVNRLLGPEDHGPPSVVVRPA